MSRRRLVTISIVTLSIVNYSCNVPTPHENFRHIMQVDIGKRMQDSTTNISRYSDQIYKRNTLSNGNIEIGLNHIGNCKVFFQVDHRTSIILDWRYEGSQKDCVVVP